MAGPALGSPPVGRFLASAHRAAQAEAPGIAPKIRHQTVRLARAARAVQRPATVRAPRRLGRVELRQKIPDPGVREGGVAEQLVRHGGRRRWFHRQRDKPPGAFLQDRRGHPPQDLD